MPTFLLSWKEVIFCAALFIFLFTPWGSGFRRYCLLGLFIYLLNKPLIANFHPGDMGWWLGDPAAWITAATWFGAAMISILWLKRRKGQEVWNSLFEALWQSHLIAISLIILALFLFHLSEISAHFKTHPDLSFALLIVNVPLQYFIGLHLLRTSGASAKHSITITLAGVLLCILFISLVYLHGTISEYKELLRISPSNKNAGKLIGQWEALLEGNKVPSIGTIRSTAYGRIGDLKLSLGDLNGARQGYQRAIREDPDDVTGHIGLARLLTRERRTEKAKATFRKAIKRNRSLSWEQLVNVFPPLRFHEIFVLARAFEAEGRQDEAFEAYGEALQMRPEDPLVNLGLGKIYLARGDDEKAITAFNKTLAKIPQHFYALSYLADIHEKDGKENLAQKYRDIIIKEVVTHHILPSDWQGRAGGDLYWNAGCYANIRLYKGRVQFQIQARGTPAQGVWPHMVVKLNKAIIGEADVTTRTFRAYSFIKDVDTGEYTLWVYFTNDRCLEKEVGGKKIREDRNLFVGAVEMIYVR
jgi:tetratricopeptide (TPR) repeat protein